MRITTRGMSDKELTEFINVMIKIDPRMEFCREFYKPICTVDHSIKPPINTIRDCNVDELICSDVMIGNSSASEFIIGRSIYLLFVGRGMVEIGERDFIEALNCAKLSKPLKTYLKLYFHIEKPKPKKGKVKNNKEVQKQ